MAGEGSRFVKIGLTKPKFQIIANGKSLFTWSLLSLSDFFEHEFIFICKESHSADNFIKEECQKLGIKKFQIINTTETTDGQASTVLLCDKLISPHDSICIYNIDTYVEEGQILQKQLNESAHGSIHVFDAEGEKWSFVRFKDDKKSIVDTVTEKKRISNWGSVGFYHFKSWSDFTNILTRHKNEIKSIYSETYIAPMYNYLIKSNKAIYAPIIDKDSIHVLGTPEDIKQFCPNYYSINTKATT